MPDLLPENVEALSIYKLVEYHMIRGEATKDHPEGIPLDLDMSILLDVLEMYGKKNIKTFEKVIQISRKILELRNE